jgi:hypothetical protein
MEEAIQSSIYVSSPDFAGWLSKRGFRVSISLISFQFLLSNLLCSGENYGKSVGLLYMVRK